MTSLTVLNQQPVEKADYQDDGSLDIVDIWYTIQGEGPFAGEPAVFIRTAGCNLDCPACDTDYTSNRKRLSPFAISQQISYSQTLSGIDKNVCKLIVITGGEPFRQNIVPLANQLISLGYRVQIETNGTLYFSSAMWEQKELCIVCSPKTGKINDRLKPYIKALKYVVEAEKVDPKDGLPTDSLGAGVAVQRPWPGFEGQVFVQPLDEQDAGKNEEHIREAVNSCLKFGYRLSIQLHKLVGLA